MAANPSWGKERISTIEDLAQRSAAARQAYADFQAVPAHAEYRRKASELLKTKQALEAEVMKEVEQETGILPFD